MKQKYLTTREAAKKANVTLATMVNWCHRFGIAIKVGGRWRINPDALDKMLRGELRNEKDNQTGEQRPPRRVLVR